VLLNLVFLNFYEHEGSFTETEHREWLATARPFIKQQPPATAASDTAPLLEPVAAISPPVLSGSSGFS
jgi:hypothetical protein